MSRVSITHNYVIAIDPVATLYEHLEVERDGATRRLTTAILSDGAMEEVRACVRRHPETFKTMLIRRPGVRIDDHLFPLQWEQWEELRILAWKVETTSQES